MLKIFKNHKFLFFSASGLFILLHLLFLDFLPIWDGFQYYRHLILNISLDRFAFMDFNVCHHPSMGYMIYLAVGQFLWPGYPIIHLQNTLLAFLACLAFYKILLYFFGNLSHSLEILLLTAIFAFNPVFFASAINLNLDFAVTCFFCFFCYSFLYGRRVLFFFSSLLLVFSKENGIFLYFIFIFFTLLFFVFPRILQKKERSSFLEAKILRWGNLLSILVPTLSILGYFLWHKATSGVFLWGYNNFDNGGWRFLFRIDLTDGHTLSLLVQFFILNFTWLLTLVVLFFLGKKFYRAWIFPNPQEVRSLSPLDLEKKEIFYVFFFTFCVFAYFFILYKNFTNPRYILPAPLFWAIFFYFCLLQITNSRPKRILYLLFVFCCTLCQNFWTIDPLSNAIYKTFDFGSHKMLRIVSLTQEPYGYAGRDQLAYNTQFTAISKLLDRLYSENFVKPEEGIILPNESNFFCFTAFSKDEKKRVLFADDLFISKVAYVSFVLPRPHFHKQYSYYLNLPWITPEETDLKEIAKIYNILPPQTIEHRGYRLKLYPLKGKDL